MEGSGYQQGWWQSERDWGQREVSGDHLCLSSPNPRSPVAILTIAIPRSLGVLVVLHRILRVLILIVLRGYSVCHRVGCARFMLPNPSPRSPMCVHKCPCMYPACRITCWCLCSTHTHPMGPAVLTFLLCMREPEHRHGVALVAGGVCSITREGSWSKEQGHRAPGSPWQPPQPSP